MSDILSQEEIDALLAAAPNIQKAAEAKPPAEPAFEPAPQMDQDFGEPSMGEPPELMMEPMGADMDLGGGEPAGYGPSPDSDMDFLDEGRVQFGAEGLLPRDHEGRQDVYKSKVRPATFGALVSSPDLGADSTNLELILDSGLDIQCELGRAERRIKDILEMGPGSVIELNKLAGEAVDLLVNARFFSKGEVVVIDQSFGVRVTDILGIEERIELLG